MSRILITTRAAVDQAGGSKGKLARALGITRSAVSQWGRYIPPAQARRVLEMWPEVAHREGK